MIGRIKNIDTFGKNIILVFIGISLVNFLNLLYQLLVAHKLLASEFAAFNSLLSIVMIISAPLGTIEMAVTKYCAKFNAHQEINKIKFLLSDFLKKTSVLAIFTLLVFWLASSYIMNLLKIPSVACGYILALLLASSWITPIFSGGVQGLELFKWVTSASIASGIIKLGLAFILILLGYNIAGALGALLISGLVSLIIFIFPLRRYISIKAVKQDINYREILIYLSPVAISSLCFMNLVNSDMVLVKYFFTAQDSGLYSLAQMVGKIFLFLPGPIRMVMFPRTSGLNAKNLDTVSTLRRSLMYVVGLCALAVIFYNIFPVFVLKALTGKAYPESIFLGRFFSISMTFFTLAYIIIFYFLSVNKTHFIKYLVLFTILQNGAIILFHQSLLQVQLILCISSFLLFFIFLIMVYRDNRT